jgi:hypothetical protein
MKIIITESQYNKLIMEQDDDLDLQKVSNYVSRATRAKYPVVDEVDVLNYFSNREIELKPKRKNGVKVYIFLSEQLSPESRTSNVEVSENKIAKYVMSLLKKFFGLTPMKVSFDSTKFEYKGGEYL